MDQVGASRADVCAIFEHWKEKRLKRGLPLLRRLLDTNWHPNDLKADTYETLM